MNLVYFNFEKPSILIRLNKRFLLKLIILLNVLPGQVIAQSTTTITSRASGKFTDASTWNLGRVPNSNDNTIIINHTVSMDNAEIWLGQNRTSHLIINAVGSLKGSGKLMIISNKSSIINNGHLEPANFDFGINSSDSAYFVNNGSVNFKGNVQFKKGSVINNGTIIFNLNSSTALENITLKNNIGASMTFKKSVHFNNGTIAYNRGAVVIESTQDDALNINTGYFYNCGNIDIKGQLNLPSGISANSPNQLINYGIVGAIKTKVNAQAAIQNWGSIYNRQNFENNGMVLNNVRGYIEQTNEGFGFYNQNTISKLTNDGFLKINGNLLNQGGKINGTGIIHIKGKSTNRDQATITGTLCINDFSKVKANLILDENINQATIASTVSACKSDIEPSFNLSPGCDLRETIVLPVQLVSFTGKASQHKINLQWQTASEEANDHFEIERSLDGVQFKQVGQVKGHGTTLEAWYYSWEDTQVNNGIYYYRLKQVDNNGNLEYSPIIAVKISRRVPQQLMAYPNPTTSKLLIRNLDLAAGEIILSLYSGSGDLLQIQKVTDKEPELNLQDLPKGIYLVMVQQTGEKAQYLRVIRD